MNQSPYFRAVSVAAIATILTLGTGCATDSGRPSRGGDAPAKAVKLNERDGGTDRVSRNGMRTTSLAYPTGERGTSVMMVEVDTPPQVRVGQSYDYTVRITNLTDTPLHNVSVRDLGTTNAQGMPTTRSAREMKESDAATKATGGDAGDGREIMSADLIGPRQRVEQKLTATADERGTLSNCLAVKYEPTLCFAVAVVEPELTLTKTGPATVSICQPIEYVYTVANTGTGIARGVRVTDKLADGLTTAEGQSTVNVSAGDLAAGQSKKVAVQLKATKVGTFSTRATAKSADLEVASRDVRTVVKQPVLAVAVEAPEARYTGEAIDYRVTVKNTGDIASEETKLSFDTTNAGQKPADVALGSIPAGQQVTRVVSLRAGSKAGTVGLKATAQSTCARPAIGDASVAIRSIAALQLECIDGQDPVRVGAETTYTVTVRNEGTGPDENIALKGTLPNELEFVSAAPGNASAVTRPAATT